MKRSTKKLLSKMASLKVAILLLSLIAIYIVIGTLLPQHSAVEWYAQQYPKLNPIIKFLSLDSAYSSPVFIALVGLFAVNLIACTALSLRPQLRQMDHDYFPTFLAEEFSLGHQDAEEVRKFLLRKRYLIAEDPEHNGFKAGKFRWGVLGATITHIGILVLFIGGTIGNIAATEDIVNLLPGNEKKFEKEGFILRLDDFYMTFDERGAVKQYISEVTLTDADGTEMTADLWVNNPLSHNGLNIYQASFGWTGNLRITDTESKEVLADGLLRAGRTYFHQPSHLTVYLYGYYPEMAVDHDQQPVTLSNREIDPHYAVILYEFGNPVGSYIIAPGQDILHNNLAITFTHAVPYTGLLTRSDPSYPVVLTGFMIILLGMFVSFYCYPRFISFSSGTLRTASRRNGWIFHQSIRSALDHSHFMQHNED